MSNTYNDNPRTEDSFDRAMRERYLHAAQHVSPPALARLRVDRHAAARGERIAMRGWAMGAVFGGLAATVFAVAFGLNFRVGQALDDSPARNLVVAVDDASVVTALDHDPDFYAWLASSDAQLMAME